MYERRHEPVPALPVFVRRVLRNLYATTFIMASALTVGVLGYHLLEGLPWVDALLNASMLLGGMGPIAPLHTTAGKLFASAYALFSGIAFIACTGILVAPFMHRFLHRFHLEA